MSLKIRRTIRETPEMTLAGTADIAFLLIVFFLAASAILELKGVLMPLPVKDAPPMEIPAKDLFKVFADREGNYIYQKNVMSQSDLILKLRTRMASNAKTVAALRIHPAAPSRIVPSFIQIARDIGLERISVIMSKKRWN